MRERGPLGCCVVLRGRGSCVSWSIEKLQWALPRARDFTRGTVPWETPTRSLQSSVCLDELTRQQSLTQGGSTCRLTHHLCLSLHVSIKVWRADDAVCVFMWSFVPVILCTCGFCPSNLFSTDSAHGGWHKCKVTHHFHISAVASGSVWACAQPQRMWLYGLRVLTSWIFWLTIQELKTFRYIWV